MCNTLLIVMCGRLHGQNKTPDCMPCTKKKPYQLKMLAIRLDCKTKTPEDDVSVADEEQRSLHVVHQFLSTLEMQNNEPL